MENQSSSSFSSLMETQFLILDQVRFLDVNEDTLSQWELVDLFDVEEEWGEQCDDDITISLIFASIVGSDIVSHSACGDVVGFEEFDIEQARWDTSEGRKIGRVAYRLLAPMENGVFRLRRRACATDVRHSWRIMCEQVMELAAEVGHGGSGSSVQETYVQDDGPLAPPPIRVAIPEHEAEEGEEESDEDYVADSADTKSSDGGDEDEFVPETPAGAAPRHVLPPPHPIPALSAVPSHYHSLHLDAMHERNPVEDSYVKPYYEGHLLARDCCMFDKVFWMFPSCVLHSDPATGLKPLVSSIVPLLQLERPPYILTSTSSSQVPVNENGVLNSSLGHNN
ncbi:hypothetical protein Ahy_B03g068056 [Arachis hypogaea]|uniref:Uncharacterized protein n=1 Tax=Arachis hypogaea TaxID=3818 RepID=A0A445A8V2_ARAHY|nr:hypothetical protein Ahy_B03g068056 [Arachis hypogaea]